MARWRPPWWYSLVQTQMLCQGSGRFPSQWTKGIFWVRSMGRWRTQTGDNFDEMVPRDSQGFLNDPYAYTVCMYIYIITVQIYLDMNMWSYISVIKVSICIVIQLYQGFLIIHTCDQYEHITFPSIQLGYHDLPLRSSWYKFCSCTSTGYSEVGLDPHSRRCVGLVSSPNFSGTGNGGILTYISCMDTAYVREFPIAENQIQETLHFRYLKLLVISWCIGEDTTLPPIIMEVKHGPIVKETSVGWSHSPLPWLWKEEYMSLYNLLINRNFSNDLYISSLFK